MVYTANIAVIKAKYLGTVVTNGQCVAFVKEAAHTPATASWKRGVKVLGATQLAAGTAIATFDPSGMYGNHTDGRSHAAIYVSQTAAGIVVYDQWVGQPVHQRTIRLLNGKGFAANDAAQFNVIG
jgi:hypothetical protein